MEVLGNIVFPDGVRPARVSVDDQRGCITTVADVDENPRPDLLVFPGFIDAHVHAREYPRPSDKDVPAMEKWRAVRRKETFSSCGDAAINGGVTLFAAMPNDPEPPDNQAVYRRKKNAAASSACPVIVFAALTSRSEPWADLPYKVYLDTHPSSVNFTHWSDLESALARYRGCRVFFHAEDPVVLSASPQAGPRWETRPADAEVRAVDKVLEFTAKFDLKTHICHMSTKDAVERIHEYNRSSANRVTCEVTPHHLFFSVTGGRVCAANGSPVRAPEMLGSNPPLRSEEDRRYLIEALREGTVDIIATDHAPHTLQDKQNGAPGMPLLDTLGSFAGWLMKDQHFTPEQIARVLSSEPGRLFASDLDVPHGRVEPGHVASFTVLSLSGSTVIEGNEIVSRGPLRTACAWSPFSGMSLPCRVAETVIFGKVYTF